MLSLDSSRWKDLQHAYGNADDIPALLRQLSSGPASDGNNEPWFSIWNSLAHQGDVYSASFAAVPHVIDAIAVDPVGVGIDYFQFPAWVEICRVKTGIEVPADLEPAYEESLARLPMLAAAVSNRDWDDTFLCCALAAIAAAKGSASLAEAILEMTGDVPDKFMQWFYDQ